MSAQSGHTPKGTSAVEDRSNSGLQAQECHPVHDHGRLPAPVSGSTSRLEPAFFEVQVEAEPSSDFEGFRKSFRLPRISDGAAEAADSRPASEAPSTYVAETQVEPPGSPESDHLTTAEIANLSAILDHDVARNTSTNYRVQWNNFTAWAKGKGVRMLPASPAQVAAYLAERIEKHGHRPSTLRVAASAIAYVHRNAGLADPCASSEVKKTLRCATRKAGRHQKQAEALTAEVLSEIVSTASEPRLGRGGRLESSETARSRGNLDIALISLMRDAMLRVSEAAALTWKDIEFRADGTGRLLIQCSKTDAEGRGAVAFLSTRTMAALELIRKEAKERDSIFGLRPNQMAGRIKKAAQAAGLGDGFSGHSPRVGMARDLARAGIELPSLMNAGRWRSATMPAHYTRNETAGRGAVAQFHGYCSPQAR